MCLAFGNTPFTKANADTKTIQSPPAGLASSERNLKCGSNYYVFKWELAHILYLFFFFSPLSVHAHLSPGLLIDHGN